MVRYECSLLYLFQKGVSLCFTLKLYVFNTIFTFIKVFCWNIFVFISSPLSFNPVCSVCMSIYIWQGICVLWTQFTNIYFSLWWSCNDSCTCMGCALFLADRSYIFVPISWRIYNPYIVFKSNITCNLIFISIVVINQNIFITN